MRTQSTKKPFTRNMVNGLNENNYEYYVIIPWGSITNFLAAPLSNASYPLTESFKEIT